jgi:TetR/AcrR family transcriptional repressor of nem operon
MKAITELIWIGSYGGTTIDQICERAGVKKGSFYYFFDSKAALAEEAIEAAWQEYRPKLDQVFSASRLPLERLHSYCEFELEEQRALKRQFGNVLGCPLCTLGTEVSTQEDGLRRKVETIMNQSRKYLETTIRDAQAEGMIPPTNPAAKAQTLYAYVEGLMTQARIRNDIEILREMERGILDLLCVKTISAKAA